MDELLGAALDAAVARTLDIQGLVWRPNGQPAYEFEWDPEARHHEDDMKSFKMWRWYTPSTDANEAVQLQFNHDIAVYPEDTAGPEKWVAGFDIAWHPEDGIELDHAACGATPQIAICRALIKRGEVIRARAWARAEAMRIRREAPAGFESKADKAAYIKALDEQRSIVIAQNPTLYPEG